MTSIMHVDPATRSTVTTAESGTTAGPTSVTLAGSDIALGVTLANVSEASPLPVSIGGSTTMDVNLVAAENASPVNVALPGVTEADPLPVTFPTAGGMNVTIVNGSPIPVSFDASGGMDVNIVGGLTNPLPVVINGGGNMDVEIVNATPIDVAISGGSINAVITSHTIVDPIPVSFDAGGGMDVNMVSLISGEDQTNNWLKTADGATQGYHLHPAGSGSVAAVPSETVLGASGAAGDYLKKLVFSVTSATTAAAFICQDGDILATNGSAGTAPTGTTTIAVTATSAVTLAQNQLVGRIIMATYTPTGASGTVKVRRRITGHAAFASATALSFTVSHAVPAGSAISLWQVEGPNSYEILPYNTPVGLYQIDFGEVSTTGAWRIAVDSGVSAHCIGKFT